MGNPPLPTFRLVSRSLPLRGKLSSLMSRRTFALLTEVVATKDSRSCPASHDCWTTIARGVMLACPQTAALTVTESLQGPCCASERRKWVASKPLRSSISTSFNFPDMTTQSVTENPRESHAHLIFHGNDVFLSSYSSATRDQWLYLFSTRHECFTSDISLSTRTRLISRVLLTSLLTGLYLFGQQLPKKQNLKKEANKKNYVVLKPGSGPYNSVTLVRKTRVAKGRWSLEQVSLVSVMSLDFLSHHTSFQ